MTKSIWRSPSEGLDLENIEKIEVFRVGERKIIQEQGWPSSFWSQASDVIAVDKSDVSLILKLFKQLKVDEPARCHMPPWGIAFYSGVKLLYTVTICFECSNSYIYSGAGKNLTAFNTADESAVELLNYLKLNLPLK